MFRRQYVSGLLAATGMVLVTACDNAEHVISPASVVGAGRPTDSAVNTLVPVTGPVISAVAASICLDVDAAKTADGTKVQSWACNGLPQQNWSLNASGQLVGIGGKCLDVDGANTANGTKVQLWTCNGLPQQKWTATASGQLVGVGGKCLDLDAGKTSNGAKIQIWTCNGLPQQKWTVPQGVVSASPVPTPTSTSTGATTVSTTSTGTSTGAAELPRVYLNTAMPAVTGRTISVPAGGDLQGALNAAQPGDQIVLAAGATYVGNFTLPAKAGMTASQWIIVRGDGALPAEGTRVGPGDAAQMPKILTPNAAAAIATTPGTQGWRFTGLEIGGTSALTMTYTLVSFGTAGSDQQTLAQVPSRLVLDRSYVHGSPTLDVRRCVALNSASSAVIDSYVSECHSRNGDSQAVMGWNGPGPFKIVDNHLEGAHENIAFGGGDPSVPGNIPADIEIRHNHVIKPLSWKGVWTAKNLVEFKAGQRILLEGNVFENNWVDAQNGFAFLWQTTNQDGGCTWCATSDVTFRSNVVRNVAGGFNLNVLGTGSTGATNPAVPLQRVTIANNVITGLDGSNGRLYQVQGAIAGVTIVNNSGVGVVHDLVFATPDQAVPDLVFRNNVTGGQYTLFAAGYMGNAGLAKMGIPAANVTGNVFASGSGAGAVPTGNSYVTSVASMIPNLASAVDPAAVLSASTVSGSTSTGASFSTIAAATQGVVR